MNRTLFLFGYTYNCNTFGDVDFKAFSKSAYVLGFVVFTISIKSVFRKGMFSFYVIASID